MRTLIKKEYIILSLIILVGVFFRFFKLDEYPVQLNHDEISQLYDLRSIVETKKDVYGSFLPLVFPSTGDYKVGHYIYISTIPYLFLGDREITIRFSAAFFGILTILAVFLFVRILTKNRLMAIFSAVFTSFTPSEIFYARKSFENVIGVSLDFFGLFFILKYLNDGANKIYGLIGIVFLSAAMYIYTSHTILVPFLILFLVILYRGKIFKEKRRFLPFLILWILLVIPLGMLSFRNADLRFRAQSVFITQDQALGKVMNLNANRVKSYIDFIPAKLLNQFDPAYLFLNGLDFTSQNTFGMGPLLVWQFPFLILGIISLIKKENFAIQRNLLFGLITLAMIPSAMTFEDFSPHRSMFSFTLLGIISSFGLYWLLNIILRSKNSFLRILFITVILSALLLNLVYFFRMYTVTYPFEKSEKIQYPFKEISQYIWSQYNNFDRIIFDPKFGEIAPFVGVGAHYYLAYYGNYPPEKFQKEFHYGNKPREILFDKFSIREVYWPVDKDLKRTLIVASPWSVPEQDIPDKNKIIQRFNFYNGKLAFYAIKL